MPERLVSRAQNAAKAIVALATPVITQLVVDSLADLSTSTEIGITALATALIVYFTPNKEA